MDETQKPQVLSEILRGFKFPFLRFVPETIDKSKPVRIVLWCHGSLEGSEQERIKFLLEPNNVDFPKFLFDSENVVLITPVIPRSKEAYTQIYDRAALFAQGIAPIYQRPDLEIMMAIEQTRAELANLGFQVEERIVGAGLSAGANMINRLSIMYPERFDRVGLLLTGTFAYPTNQLGETALAYPLGTGDLEDAGLYLNLSAFKTIDHFIYVGDQDPNRGPQDFLWNNPPLLSKAQYETLFGDTTQETTRHFVTYLRSLGIKVQEIVGKGLGHTTDDITLEELVKFLTE